MPDEQISETSTPNDQSRETVTLNGSTQTLLLATDQPKVTLEPGVYSVSLQSNLSFNGPNFPCKQAILMNMDPIYSNNSLGWYEVINVEEPTTLTITHTCDVYVVILDQYAKWDNNGQVTVTFDPA